MVIKITADISVEVFLLQLWELRQSIDENYVSLRLAL